MSDNDFHFASEVVDVSAHDLPGLKAAFVVGRVADGSVVVDVGCGGGKMLRTINEHRRGVTLLGCDVKEPTDINGDFTFTALDRSTGLLPYEDSSVDIALLVDVLEHVDYPETTLSEIARILRPDGRMLAFVPIEGEPISWFSVFRAFSARTSTSARRATSTRSPTMRSSGCSRPGSSSTSVATSTTSSGS